MVAVTVYTILALVCAAWTLTLLVGGYRLWRAHVDLQAERDDHAAEIADLRDIHTAALAKAGEDIAKQAEHWIATLSRVVGDLERARLDLEWANIVLAITESERDMYQTALRGELTRQVNAEVLRPEDAADEAVVVEFPTRGRA